MKKNIEVVMTKYIAGGKEIVKYDAANGKCWVERIKGGETTVVKEFEVGKPE